MCKTNYRLCVFFNNLISILNKSSVKFQIHLYQEISFVLGTKFTGKIYFFWRMMGHFFPHANAKNHFFVLLWSKTNTKKFLIKYQKLSVFKNNISLFDTVNLKIYTHCRNIYCLCLLSVWTVRRGCNSHYIVNGF